MDQKTYQNIQQEDFEAFFLDEKKKKNDSKIAIPLNLFVDDAQKNNNSTVTNSTQYSSIFSKNLDKKPLLKNGMNENNLVISLPPTASSIVTNQPRKINPSVLAELKVDYIRRFISSFPEEMQQEFLGLYTDFFQVQIFSGKKDKFINEADQNKKNNMMLYLFEKESEPYFLEMKPSSFCSAVRDIIIVFEEKMEYREPMFRDELWKKRHLELFCLKYFCINAARLRNDIYLICFINEIKDLSETAVASSYNEFKNRLKELVDLRRRGGYDPIFANMDADKSLVIERQQLELTNNELRTENQLIKNDSNALKEAVTRDLETKLKMDLTKEIAEAEARLEEKFSAQQNNNICRIL